MTSLIQCSYQNRIDAFSLQPMAVAFGAALLLACNLACAQVETSAGATIHAVNLQIKSLADFSLCIETDVATNPTPRIFVALCTGRSSQRWAFTDGADGTSVVVGDLALCLAEETGPTPHGLRVERCTYHSNQRFAVSATGMIQPKATNRCFTIATPPVVGEEVFVEDCLGSNDRSQAWRFIQ